MAAFITVTAMHRVMTEELLAQAESNGYKRGPIERETALETIRGTYIRLKGIKI
jgi:hypothetical protein